MAPYSLQEPGPTVLGLEKGASVSMRSEVFKTTEPESELQAGQNRRGLWKSRRSPVADSSVDGPRGLRVVSRVIEDLEFVPWHSHKFKSDA
jgi:hypothetical protein